MARGLADIYPRTYDSTLVISYHVWSSDTFYTGEAASRERYYGYNGTAPVYVFDGFYIVTGGRAYGNSYPFIQERVAWRLALATPLVINLSMAYNPGTNNGTVTANIQNTGATPVRGILHFVLNEDHIPVAWGPTGGRISEINHVVRDMMPDTLGEMVTVPAGSNIIRSRVFTVNSRWNENNCRFAVFVQDSATRNILQGEDIAVMQVPKMRYGGMKFIETSKNTDRVPQPGESIRMFAMGRNMGDSIYAGSAAISETDPYITITGSAPQSVSINKGGVDTVNIVNFDISPSCPSPHLAKFVLNFGSSTDTVRFMIANAAGWYDNMESGDNGWTHGNPDIDTVVLDTMENWHLSTRQSHSATHAWYSGKEATGLYTNQNDSRLTSPYFIATPDSTLRFWNWHDLRSGDYGYLDVDNGSGSWRHIARFDSVGDSIWTQYGFSMAQYSGETIRIRFRFSSNASITGAGWYIDDVSAPATIGVAENRETARFAEFSAQPTLFSRRVTLSCTGHAGTGVEFAVYDAAGRLVNTLKATTVNGEARAQWSGDDVNGNRLGAGVYFVSVEDGDREITEKVILMK